MGSLSPAVARLGPAPRIVMVLGKGGVGRSTVATALGLALAAQGERVLVLEWTFADPIAAWFGHAAAGTQPLLVMPRLSVANYDLDEALRAYFVDHLHMGFFYRRVIHAPSLRRMIDAAPGLAELLFLGQLWWLTTLAEQEAGLAFDRIVVDAPATGHGLGVLGMSAALSEVGASGMLGLEVERVQQMMADPQRIGTLVVAVAEEMVCEETRELVPQVAARLGRRPLAVVLNRSVSSWVGAAPHSDWLEGLTRSLSPGAGAALDLLYVGLQARGARERRLGDELDGATELGTWSLPEVLPEGGAGSPRKVVEELARRLAVHVGRP